MNDEADKGKLNKFICKNYETDEKGDISLWNFVWQSIEFILAICVIKVLMIGTVIIIGAVVFTLPGFMIQSVINNTLDVPITASTVIISITADVVIIAIILLIKWSMDVNVAHCPVKEEFCGESSQKRLVDPCKYSNTCKFTKCQNHGDKSGNKPRDQWWGYTD